MKVPQQPHPARPPAAFDALFWAKQARGVNSAETAQAPANLFKVFMIYQLSGLMILPIMVQGPAR